ncbi:hypothetical protein CRG98_023207 [Punica granatum]|uniref:Uncharacterized protein n=1 Tax=Punica granatum TaxID=22663 RepID=A0A2I0JJF6_PUNGR|nr:hypothetical protein CRG98_023207 [Punica granatum]
MAQDNQIDVSEEIDPPAPVHSQAPIAQSAPPPSPTGALPAHLGAPSAYLPPSTSVTTTHHTRGFWLPHRYTHHLRCQLNYLPKTPPASPCSKATSQCSKA